MSASVLKLHAMDKAVAEAKRAPQLYMIQRIMSEAGDGALAAVVAAAEHGIAYLRAVCADRTGLTQRLQASASSHDKSAAAALKRDDPVFAAACQINAALEREAIAEMERLTGALAASEADKTDWARTWKLGAGDAMCSPWEWMNRALKAEEALVVRNEEIAECRNLFAAGLCAEDGTVVPLKVDTCDDETRRSIAFLALPDEWTLVRTQDTQEAEGSKG